MANRKSKVSQEPCDAMMASQVVPGHIHTCLGKHSKHEDHFCGECHRWWWGVR